jgi:hypothetical protein
MAFVKNFAQGKKGEKYVKQSLVSAKIECEFNEDSTKRLDYDLAGKFGKKKFTIEVKLDFMAARTGNIAIEYYNSSKGEKSGVDATKATIWAHIIMDEGNPTIWLTSVKSLKSYIKNNTPFRTVSAAGDGNAELHLYKSDIILPAIFHRIDNISEEQKKKIIKELIK